MEKDRNTDGRFKSDTTDAEILAGVRAHEPAATSEVATEVDMTRQGADRRLRQLRDEGRVNSKKIGASLVWFAPQQDATPDQSPTNPGDRERAAEGVADTADETTEDAVDPIGDALDGWEPDTEANPRTARAQTRRAAEFLQDVGEFRRTGELQDALADDSSLSVRGWWERHARPGLNHLADAGLVEYVKNRGYRWTGEDADAGEDSGIYDPTEEFR